MLLDDLPVDVPILLGKCKLFRTGLGPSRLPLSASYSSVWHLTWDISSLRRAARRAEPPRRSPGGVGQAQMNWRWTAAGTQRRGWAAALSHRRAPWGCCTADGQPARSVRAETAGTSPNMPGGAFVSTEHLSTVKLQPGWGVCRVEKDKEILVMNYWFFFTHGNFSALSSFLRGKKMRAQI